MCPCIWVELQLAIWNYFPLPPHCTVLRVLTSPTEPTLGWREEESGENLITQTEMGFCCRHDLLGESWPLTACPHHFLLENLSPQLLFAPANFDYLKWCLGGQIAVKGVILSRVRAHCHFTPPSTYNWQV